MSTTKKAGTRVRVKIIDTHSGMTMRSWVIVVRGAANQKNALVRARMKARQHSEYEPGDHIEAEIAKPKARKTKNPGRKARRVLPKRKANGQFVRKARKPRRRARR